MNVPKVIEVLRRVMTNSDRPADERAAAATAILLLCNEGADEQPTPEQKAALQQQRQETDIRAMLASLNARAGGVSASA